MLLTTLPMLLLFTLNLVAAGYMVYYYDRLVERKFHPVSATALSILLYVSVLGFSMYLSGKTLTLLPENTPDNLLNLTVFSTMFVVQSIPFGVLHLLKSKKVSA